MSTVTKPIALDETLQSTNTALGSLGKDTTLQAIATAIANVGLSNIGNMSSLATTDKTSLVSAINEVVGDVSDLDTDKADKVTSATSGNLAGLNASGNLTDSGWDGAKTTTSASGNPISITGLKSNQLAVNPVITFEPIQDLHGQSNPYPGGGGRNLLSIDNPGSSTQEGVTFTVYDDGKITANGTSTSSAGTCCRNVMLGLGDLKPGSSYKIASNGNILFHVLQYANGSWSNLVLPMNTTQTFTISSSATDLLVRAVGNTGTVYTNAVSYPVIVESTETDTSFAPYENICEISGYDKIEVLSCGKNLLDRKDFVQGSVSSTGEDTTSTIRLRSPFLRIDNTKSYTIRCNAQVRIFEIEEYDISRKWFRYAAVNLTTYVFTPNSNTSYIKILIRKSDNSTIVPSELTSFMIEEGTPTDYQDYHKTTDLSEPLPQTVYSGSWTVRDGKLVSNLGSIDLGSLTFTKDTSYSQNVFYAYSTSIPIPKNDSASVVANIISEIYTADSANNIDRATTNYTVGVMQYSTGVRVWICDSRYTSATDLQTALSGVKAVYELKTPIEIQLTPHEISLLKDYAYVSTNGTSMSFDYHNGEIATLGDVSQLGETVNLIGEKVEFEDVSQYFIKDDTNINSANISAYRIGKMVFISGNFTPNALSSLQNKILFNITNDKILPLSGNIPVSGIYIPIISQSGTAWPIILSINKLNKRIKTDNNGAYGAITNITTNSLITFSASYICQG